MVNSDDLAFPVVNLVGSALIVYLLLQDFNLGWILIGGFWIAISAAGIIQHLRLRRTR